ncbi:MAG: potassium transporter [Deltaproteobacteria bacterium]|nr:potassium transporter [Deltaproteobacteria bacterium]
MTEYKVQLLGAVKRFFLQYVQPVHLAVLSFALLITCGASLLHLPISSSTGEPLSWLEAFFSATSAVCVTGLSVIDISTRLSRFGQTILMLLVQLGGLGIMTFSTVLITIIGRRLSFRGRSYIVDTFTHTPRSHLGELCLYILLVTFGIELLGAVGLYFCFAPRLLTTGEAIYYSIFHSITAFCNAGFSLFSDSFLTFNMNVPLLFLVMTLIVSGGMGFLVLRELFDWSRERIRGKKKYLSLHSKLVLTVTASLIFFGAVMFYLFEQKLSLYGLSWDKKILNSIFQSISFRTAGFNTIDFKLSSGSTLFLGMTLMFIGASPGSCGGGVKTTTFGVIFAQVKSGLTGGGFVNLFKRTLLKSRVDAALTLIVLSFMIITVATVTITGMETGLVPFLQTERGLFLDILFEVTSAFGTVGMSTGRTPYLSDGSKWVLIMVMFVGRLGPLTFVVLTTGRKRKGEFQYAEENVMIG